MQHSARVKRGTRLLAREMDRSPTGNILTEVSIMDFLQEEDKSYVPRDDSVLPSDLPPSTPEGSKSASLPGKFDIFKKLLEIEENNEQRLDEIRVVLGELRDSQGTLNVQQMSTRTTLNEARNIQSSILEQQEQTHDILRDCEGTNRKSYQLRADAQEMHASMETKFKELNVMHEKVQGEVDQLSLKHAELENISIEIQGKVQWTVAQNEQVVAQTAQLSELQRSINSSIQKLEDQEKRCISRQEYIAAQESSLSKILAEAKTTMSDLNNFKKLISEQYSELVLKEQEFRDRMTSEREKLYADVKQLKSDLVTCYEGS